MRFFGGLGLTGILISLLTFLYLTGLYVLTDTQQRPIFIAAGVLAIISVLLLLVGFLAELIVSQGERINELERRLQRQANAVEVSVQESTNENHGNRPVATARISRERL